MAYIEGIKIECECGNSHFLTGSDYFIYLAGDCCCCPSDRADLVYTCPNTKKEIIITNI